MERYQPWEQIKAIYTTAYDFEALVDESSRTERTLHSSGRTDVMSTSAYASKNVFISTGLAFFSKTFEKNATLSS